MNIYVDPRRESILELAKILVETTPTDGTKRAVVGDLERLVKAEKEYMDRLTATECVESCAEAAKRPTPATDLYTKNLWLLQAMCDENRPASERLTAFDELQTAMYREKYKFERAADEEHKKVMLTRAANVTGLERNIDEFLKDREHYRSRTSIDRLGASLEYDRRICTLIKNYVRYSLKLPQL